MTAPNLGINGMPTAKIAVNRNVVKHYGNKIYLKNKTHFEIELFNPKTKKVLAKIYVNGEPISSSGIVIRPGQRVFLERWLDESRKFLFETYEVENSSEAKEAIKENGKIRVEFYDESIPQQIFTTWPNQPFQPYNPIYGNPTYEPNPSIFYCSASIGASASDVTLNASQNSTPTSSVETGRAEKGENSNQSFVTDNSSFDWWSSSSIDLQILPESQKPIEIEKVRNYCTSCGTRMKSSTWKFCPSCGTQI